MRCTDIKKPAVLLIGFNQSKRNSFDASCKLDSIVECFRALKTSLSLMTSCFYVRIVERESGGTRRSTVGEVKGKEANGVGTQHSSA